MKKKPRPTITIKDILDMLPKGQLREDTGLSVMCEENNECFISVRLFDHIKMKDNTLCLVPDIPLIPDYVRGYLAMCDQCNDLKDTMKKLRSELRAAKRGK